MPSFVPTIVRHPSQLTIGIPSLLRTAHQEALQEFQLQTSWLRDFRMPSIPTPPHRRFTFAHVGQWLRSLIGAYADSRTLDDAIVETMDTSLGPLPWAVTRAIGRHARRGYAGPAPILEIGAGQRLVPAGLKALYGDTIAIAEVAPRFGRIARPAIDRELAEVDIDRATLPGDSCELVYSFFGSMYGRDQLGILQKILDSLRIGGETFVMWKEGRRHNALSAQVRSRSSVFPRYGFDITTRHCCYFPSGHLHTTQYHTVWARKRASAIDVRGAFDAVAQIDANQDMSDAEHARTMVHLSQDGIYFPGDWLTRDKLHSLTSDLLKAGCNTFDMDADEACYRLTGKRSEMALADLVEFVAGRSLAYLFEGESLSQLVLPYIAEAMHLRADNTTASAEADADYDAFARPLEQRSISFHP